MVRKTPRLSTSALAWFAAALHQQLLQPAARQRRPRGWWKSMAAAFGGAQSIFTCAFDEAFQIPIGYSPPNSPLRTQQISTGYESGIASTVDPLGGSYFPRRARPIAWKKRSL